MPREAVVDRCGVCIVGEAMEQFAIEGIDQVGWDVGSGQFIKTCPHGRVRGVHGGEALEQFAIEGIDHMGWDAWSGQFFKTNPKDPPLMEVQVKVL